MLRPRVTASSAVPVPTMPPPTTSTSSSPAPGSEAVEASASSARSLACGPRALGWLMRPSVSGDGIRASQPIIGAKYAAASPRAAVEVTNARTIGVAQGATRSRVIAVDTSADSRSPQDGSTHH